MEISPRINRDFLVQSFELHSQTKLVTTKSNNQTNETKITVVQSPLMRWHQTMKWIGSVSTSPKVHTECSDTVALGIRTLRLWKHCSNNHQSFHSQTTASVPSPLVTSDRLVKEKLRDRVQIQNRHLYSITYLHSLHSLHKMYHRQSTYYTATTTNVDTNHRDVTLFYLWPAGKCWYVPVSSRWMSVVSAVRWWQESD